MPQWRDCIIVPVHKPKKDKKFCESYRPVSLINHMGKIVERMIYHRLLPHVLSIPGCIPDTQCGGMPSLGTVDAIHVTRTVSSSAYDNNTQLFKCYIDLTKAYDLVHQDVLWVILASHGVPPMLLRFIKNLFTGAKAQVKVNGALSNPIDLVSGVKQGSVLSPLLFNIYSGVMIAAMRREYELSDIKCGTRLRTKHVKYFDPTIDWGEITLHEMLYVDDVVLFAETEEALQRMVSIFEGICGAFGKQINANSQVGGPCDNTPWMPPSLGSKGHDKGMRTALWPPEHKSGYSIP
jgi:hypothetical protein